MKVKVAAALLGASMALAGAAVSVAADTSVDASSSTTLDFNSLCASQTTLVQVDGSSLIDRSDATCAP